MPRTKSSTTNSESVCDDTCRLTLYSIIRWSMATLTTLYLAPLHLSCHIKHPPCPHAGFMSCCCCFSSACLTTFLSSLFTKESFCKAWEIFLDKPVPVLIHSAVVNLVLALILVRIRGTISYACHHQGINQLQLASSCYMSLPSFMVPIYSSTFSLPLTIHFRSWERTCGWALYSSTLVIFPLALRAGFDRESYQRLLLTRSTCSNSMNSYYSFLD